MEYQLMEQRLRPNFLLNGRTTIMSTQGVTIGTRASDHNNGFQSTEEMIRLRAYQLYEERGRVDGHAEYDWQQAECDILSRLAGRNVA
jgi:hypothetical protein